MPKTKKEKEKIIQEIRDELKKSKTILFLDFTGISASDLFSLRKKIKQIGRKLKATKKTLVQVAFDKEKIKANIKDLEGQLVVAFGQKEDIELIKIVCDATKETNLKIRGGLLEQKILTPQEIFQLSLLPTKDQLLSQFFSLLSFPISNFVFVLKSILSSFVFALSQIKGQKEK